MSGDGKQRSGSPLPRPSIELVLLERAKTYRYAILLGISIGAVFCAAGFVLALLGLAGTIEFFVEAVGIKARLANASPGAFFALLGMVLIWRFKPKMDDDVSANGGGTDTSEPKIRKAVFRAGTRSGSTTGHDSKD